MVIRSHKVFNRYYRQPQPVVGTFAAHGIPNTVGFFYKISKHGSSQSTVDLPDGTSKVPWTFFQSTVNPVMVAPLHPPSL